VWVDDIDGAVELFASDNYNTVIAADEANFLHRSIALFLHSKFLYSNEALIVE